MAIKLKIKKLHSNAVVPNYQTPGAAAMDLVACIENNIILAPGERQIVPTGISIELPPGYEAQIRARSGMAAKNGIGLVNGIGTVDSDYRGEVGVLLINWGSEVFTVQNGDRIAQMVISKYEVPEVEVVDELSSSERAGGGFGSTGSQYKKAS